MTRGGSRSRTPSVRSSRGKHGAELFVTSLTGEYVRIYPMPVWLALEEKLGRMPSTHPARLKFFDRVNYYGQMADIDTQGRVLIHRAAARCGRMSGDVDVLRPVRLPRRLEPRTLRREAAARAVHRRRRARARGVRDLIDDAARTSRSWRARSSRCSQPARGGLFVDCTVGLGGHARALLEAGATRVIGLDRDADALALAARVAGAVGDRVELVHADYRELAAVLDGARHRRGSTARWPISACRRCSSTPTDAASASAATSRWTCGWIARRGRPRPICCATIDETRARRRDLPVRRGAVLAAHRARHRRARADGADRDDRRSWPRSCAGRCRGAAISASIRRRGRFRRCASGSTASSRGSTRSSPAPRAGCCAGRAAGRHHVPLARGSHREAHVPRARASRRRRCACSRKRPSCRATTKSARNPARAQREAASHREAGMSGWTSNTRSRRTFAITRSSARSTRRGSASCGGSIGIGAVLVVGAAVLGLAALRAACGTATQIERLQQERAAEEEVNRHLRLEIETLRAPRRIEAHRHTEAAHGRARPRSERSSSSGSTPPAPPGQSIVAAR